MTLILKGVKDRLDVKVTAKVEQGLGKSEPVTFVATYRRPPSSEVKDLIRQMNDRHAEPISDDDLLDRYLMGWKGLLDAEGEEITFTQENLDQVLEVMEYRVALVDGMTQVVFGKSALAKN